MDRLSEREKECEKILKRKDSEISLEKDSFQYYIKKRNKRYAFCKNDIERLRICAMCY